MLNWGSLFISHFQTDLDNFVLVRFSDCAGSAFPQALNAPLIIVGNVPFNTVVNYDCTDATLTTPVTNNTCSEADEGWLNPAPDCSAG